MGRSAKGWSFVKGRIPYAIRFRHAGERYVISTGESDPRRAAEEAARLYAATIHGKRRRVARSRRAITGALDVLFAEWLAWAEPTLDAKTFKTYKVTYVGTHWLPRWKGLGDLHDASLSDYANERMGQVLKVTVRKELSALFGFLGWCVDHGHLDESEMPRRPRLKPKLKGKRVGPQRAKAPDLSPEQIEAVLAALPEWSRARKKQAAFPIRARFVVAYETGLRPATLDALTWDAVDLEEHALRIEDDEDKARFGRTVPLSARALDALTDALADLDCEAAQTERVAVFGAHDYRHHLAKASEKAGLAKPIAPYDFRHSRITHLLERGANVPGVMHLVGHTQIETTSKYTHPSRRAAEQALEATTWKGTDANSQSGSKSPTEPSSDGSSKDSPPAASATASTSTSALAESGSRPSTAEASASCASESSTSSAESETAPSRSGGPATSLVESPSSESSNDAPSSFSPPSPATSPTSSNSTHGLLDGRSEVSGTSPMLSPPCGITSGSEEPGVVRRTRIERARELPHWNLNPTDKAKTSGKPEAGHVVDAAENRTEPQASGSPDPEPPSHGGWLTSHGTGVVYEDGQPLHITVDQPALLAAMRALAAVHGQVAP